MSAIFEYGVCERVLVSWMYSDVFFPANENNKNKDNFIHRKLGVW